MRVDDRNHRLIRDGFDLVEDRLAPAGELGIDDHHAAIGDERGRVPAASGDHIKVILHFFDLGDVWSLRTTLSARRLNGGDRR